MLEELLEVGEITREEELTAFAYLMTQATYNTHLVNRLNVITYMAQSTRHQMDHSQHFITTMCRVQYAMFPPGEQCWWYLQSPPAPPPGHRSTMATWWVHNIIIIVTAWVCWSKPWCCTWRYWKCRWSTILPCGSNLHWDCVSSIHSWERAGLCSVHQVNFQCDKWTLNICNCSLIPNCVNRFVVMTPNIILH